MRTLRGGSARDDASLWEHHYTRLVHSKPLVPSHTPNVGLSCKPRKQARQPVRDAVRSAGDCQIQALVGLRLGPSLTRRSMECQGRPGLLLLPIAVFRCGEHLPGGRGLLGLFWTATCPSERGEREPLPPRAVHGSSGSRWSSWCGPPAESLRVRPFPRFLAHSQPPCGRWYQEGVAGQRACFKKVGPADAPCSGGRDGPDGQYGVGRNRSRVACNARWSRSAE